MKGVVIKIGLFFVSVFLFLSVCNVDEKAGESTSLDNYDDCPPEGNAKSARISELNKLKNRNIFPAQNDFDTIITLKKLLQTGNDHERWNTLKAAKITGYVYEVKPGGVETCNCKEKEIDGRDTHIEILLDPINDTKIQRVIVEVTPRIRQLMKVKGENWSTRSLRDKLLGRWVTFEGWLLFDAEHESQAENTNPGRERNWRATAWEIHPVTNFKITTKPR